MHIVENHFPSNASVIPEIFRPYFSGCSMAALDIETTGLSKDHSTVILIGVLTKLEDKFLITQFFADSPREEPELLARFLDFIGAFDVIFNYNGTAFDIPFLNQRILKAGLAPTIPLCKSFDLYRIVRSSFLSEALPNLKLKTVEKLAGIHREDQISGKESVLLYKKYVSTKDKALARKILLHNYEDLTCFTSFANLLRKIDFHQAIQKHGFPIRTKKCVCYVSSINAGKGQIEASGTVLPAGMDCTYYLENQTLLVDGKTGIFRFQFYTDAPFTKSDYRSVNLALMDALRNFLF